MNQEAVTQDTSHFYWDAETNQAVDAFVEDKSLTKEELDRLYTQELYPTIDEMIQAIIHRYRFYETGLTVPDLINEVHTKVYSVLVQSREHDDKYYDPSKGASFFYFTATIKNHLINMQKDSQFREDSVATYDADQVPDENKQNDADYLLNSYLDWVEANYTDLFTNPADLKIAETFVDTVRGDWEEITTIRGLSEVMYQRIEMEKDKFYDRYYKTKTILNKVYNKLRQLYNQGKPITPDTNIVIPRRY